MTIQYSDHPKAEVGAACSICGRIPDRPRVEHCHAPLDLRGGEEAFIAKAKAWGYKVPEDAFV